MRVLLKLAIRNLLAAGLRTWLNVVVLSLTFVVIITAQGLFRGMGDQAARASVDYEFGGGQFWHPAYDPYDPLTIQDAHGSIPAELKPLIASGQATPILIIQGTLYPQGRFLPVLVKGIDPAQNILKLPSQLLAPGNVESGARPENQHLPNSDSSAPSRPVQEISGGRDANQAAIRSLPSPSLPAGESSDIASQAGIPDEIPAIIGTRMATAARLSVGDTVILRWRDSRGAFDARPIRIVHIFRTIVQSVDAGQVWIPLRDLQALARMPDEATIVTLAPGFKPPSVAGAGLKNSGTFEPRVRESSNSGHDLRTGPGSESGQPIILSATWFSGCVPSSTEESSAASVAALPSRPYEPALIEAGSPPSPASQPYGLNYFTASLNTVPVLLPQPADTLPIAATPAAAGDWVYRDPRFLLRDIDRLVTAKTAGSATVYVILLFMSLLAIFDTQVLSIFHRIKEIGTLVALGLTRRQIVLLFTLEGTLHAVLAAILAALYGYPLLSAFARTGWKMPEAFDSFGIALGERLVPVFTGGIIIGTVILIMTLTAIVSFMPARRLSRMRPTDALRGKLQ